MAGLLEKCEELFNTKNLYKIFKVEKGVPQDKLKKAYYKLSLKVHPDKVADAEKEEATEKFQLLSKLYQIISDDKKRKIYDKTGEIDEDDGFGLSDDKDWMEYWRELFPIVTVDDINKFSSEFKGSDEELSSLKEAYTTCKGDMQKIIDSVMCASIDDEQRFRDILTPLIQSKELPEYKKFTNESAASKKKRATKATKESKAAEKAIKELKGGSLDGYNDLALAMQRNKEKRGGILSYLEDKYAKHDDEDDLVIDFKASGSKKRSKKQQSKSTPKASTSKRQKKT